MKASMILEKIWHHKKEFVTSEEIAEYCNVLNIEYKPAMRYLLKSGYLRRIFNGIFYVRTFEESKRKITARYTHLELVSKGLKVRGVKKWYFGLHTALKLNNMTHEYFSTDDVINDVLFRPKPVTIAGSKFKFFKVSPKLFGFGIKSNDKYAYSDPEKTILDFVYLMSYRGMPKEYIPLDVADWAKDVSKYKIRKYLRYYPKAIAGAALEAVAV